MKLSQRILFFAITGFTLRLHATNEVAPELLSYNLKTTVGAYERAGRKNPKWDAAAKGSLEAFARIRSSTNGLPESLFMVLKTNLPVLATLKCDDPMIRYLQTRYVPAAGQSAAQLQTRYAEVASALETNGYPAIRTYYARLWVYRTAAEAGTE